MREKRKKKRKIKQVKYKIMSVLWAKQKQYISSLANNDK